MKKEKSISSQSQITKKEQEKNDIRNPFFFFRKTFSFSVWVLLFADLLFQWHNEFN